MLHLMEHKLCYQHFIVTKRPMDVVFNEQFSGGVYDTVGSLRILDRIFYGLNLLFLKISSVDNRWNVTKRPGYLYTDLLVTKNSTGGSIVTYVLNKLKGIDCYYANFKGPLIKGREQKLYIQSVNDDTLWNAIANVLNLSITPSP